MAKRKRHSGEFKAEIVLQALRGEESVAGLAATHDINPSMLHKWIKETKSVLPKVFSGKIERSDNIQEQKIKLLHEKIGQLTVERDFWADAYKRKKGRVRVAHDLSIGADG